MTADKGFATPIAGKSNQGWLRAATVDDLENLRQWKNRNRESFFHKEDISCEQQQGWFQAYQSRQDDFMFIVQHGARPVGCMGIRLVDGRWDVYNVILGAAELRGSGLMGSALEAMLRFARSRRQAPITLKVLKSNRAIDWYRSNGFVVAAEHADHFSMSYRPAQ